LNTVLYNYYFFPERNDGLSVPLAVVIKAAHMKTNAYHLPRKEDISYRCRQRVNSYEITLSSMTGFWTTLYTVREGLNG